MTVLLEGVIEPEGAQYDAQRLGVYAAPTERFHGLTPPQSVLVDPPARILLEAREFCVRGLECEPSVLRLLWASELTRTPLGEQLIAERTAFLSGRAVAVSYLRAMEDELVVMAREDSREEGARLAARRLHRLSAEALQLHRTGNLDPDPDWKREEDLAAETLERGIVAALAVKTETQAELESSFGALPTSARTATVESWLKHVRTRYFLN